MSRTYSCILKNTEIWGKRQKLSDSPQKTAIEIISICVIIESEQLTLLTNGDLYEKNSGGFICLNAY